jgi:voltage-gated potassium channel
MKKIIKKIVYFLSLSITKFFLLFLFLILLFSLVILITEKNNSDINNFFDSLWFIIVSLTTTGYGDIIPSTNNGKLITLIAILAGIILTAIITGELASIIIEIREKRGKGLMNFSKKKIILLYVAGKMILQIF